MIKNVISPIKYALRTRRAWWFTATARTRARYSRTILGSLWLGISNLLFVLILGFVYGFVFNVENFKEYYIYLGLGFSAWNTIGGSLNSSPNIFENNSANLINSTLNPIFYVLEEWAFQIQNFFQAFLMVVVFLSLLDYKIFFNFLICSPIHFLNISIFIFWAPLIICLLASKYCDIYQLIPIFTQLIFLLSPILYQEKNLGSLSLVADYNLIYKVLALFRDSIILGNFYWMEGLILLLINLIMTIISINLLESKKNEIIYYL
ncbi:MAG: phosphate ABC transporter permease [Pelagibacteraceae bacterium TMED124]|nr:MAG: phosphate ABC transporter permease [Pelagibacteraceae bacterium TMED124]|tara:strand:- start:6211 stop:6999 length:789 start_codon:yes stop_codon:yes gene_type:complete